MRLSVDSNFMCRAMYKVVDPMMHGLWNRVSDFAEIRPGERAIDICCGTGSLAIHYANLGIITDAIDYDPFLISNANQKLSKMNLKNISFHLANALYLPFEDNIFDYASISLSLHEKKAHQQDQVILEMQRVVKKEGTLILIDYAVPVPRIPTAYASRMLEICAGREHYRCFKEYVRHGGLNGLLMRNEISEEKSADLGPLTIIRSTNHKQLSL